MGVLNLERWNYAGPMGFNDELAEKIRKEGKQIKISELTVDKECPKFSVSLYVLHVPTNKVNNYEIYAEYETGKLRAFDGFGMPPVSEPIEDFMFIYEEKKRTGSDSSFHPDEKYLDKTLKDAREEGKSLNEVDIILKNKWEERNGKCQTAK